MLYPIIGFIAIIVHLIINHEIVFKKNTRFRVTADMDYRLYLNSVLVYYITDALWGVFDYRHLPELLYIDTVFYYVAAVFTVVFWVRYIVSYLDLRNKVGNALMVVSSLFFLLDMIAIITNFFSPVFFWVDADGIYHTGFVRYIALVVQIFLFVFVGILTYKLAKKDNGLLKRRYAMFCLFSFSMVACIIAQGFFALLPLYTLGLMIGTCELHVFVLEDEMDQFRRQLISNEKKLKESSDIIANAGFGIWKIRIEDNGEKTMLANDKLQEILGISEMEMSPEALYDFYHGRLEEDVDDIEQNDYRSMKDGYLRSRILAWNHPSKGRIYLHAGGSSYTQTGGEMFISGYCEDITVQRKHELRNNRVINTLARSYDFVNYVVMKDMTFITSSNRKYSSEKDISGGDVLKAIDFSCNQRVAEAFREEMRTFADLSTLDERMKNINIVINQFKDMNEVWHEWSYIVVDRNDDGTIKHLIWAVRKIEDEKRAEIRRQQILDDNIAANKAKTMFLQNMSHEIRTPLNAMFGFAQLLGLPDGTWSEEEKEQYNHYIFNSYNLLDMLIGDIIDTADSEHGNYRIDLGDVEVNNVCRNALMSVEYRKPANVNMYFTSDVPDDHMVRSDGRRIQQVLINYLSNACKHTEKGEIHLHCSTSENPGKLTFSVTDTGEGVPAEKADIIFNRFTKLNQFVQGSGLGLNICLTIANKLGGEVFLDTHYTEGARFVFIIDNI